MAEFNENGGLEISPGPRGFSIISFEVSEDGTMFRGVTNQPGFTNWVPLYRGPRGLQGEYGDPGESRVRVDESVGYRVFQWDVVTTGEQMVYGDTGTWETSTTVTNADATTTTTVTRFRRTGNAVETNAADPTTLPAGFRPAVAGATGLYLTAEAWPTTVTGTIVQPPQTLRGLEGYEAAVAQGYPGTAEEFMDMAYRVVLPPAGTTGQVLTRTDAGSAWMDPTDYGPQPWTNITLADGWTAHDGNVPSVRYNSGTIEMIGEVRWTGASKTVGVWGADFQHIGNIPPGFAPTGHFDTPVRVHRGEPGVGTQNYPTIGRVDVNELGQVYLGAMWLGEDNRVLPLEAGETMVNMGNISYPLRNS